VNFIFSPSVAAKITKSGRIAIILERFSARRAPTTFGTHKIITSSHIFITITYLNRIFTRMKTLSRGYMLQFQKKSHLYIFLDFTVANWSMTSSKLISSKFSLSILRRAKLLRRSCPILARKHDRISFSLLKDRSLLAIGTATVRRIWREIRRFENTLYPYATINSRKSTGVHGKFLTRVLSNILIHQSLLLILRHNSSVVKALRWLKLL